jgi:heat shock protein HslJ
MKPILPLILLLASLAACRGDDSARVYDNPDQIWTLKSMGGAAFPVTATLTFPKSGEIAGQAPCNRYFGALNAHYPSFETGPIGSTRMACPDMDAEPAFLVALEAATTAQVDGDTLTLSNTDGLEMVFTATD